MTTAGQVKNGSLVGGERRVTEELATWASSVTPNTLPREVAHHGRRVVLDYLAAATAGSTTELSAKLRKYFHAVESGYRSTVIAGPTLTAGAAAYVNGAAAHGLELDDGYTPGSVHPGACVVPAVLAVAEAQKATVDEVAAAVIVGVEVTARIAEAAHPNVLHAGFHNTPVAGVFGAAAAVSNLLKLADEATTGAFGLAGSYAGGLREYHAHASEVKRLHTAKAARDGLTCAELAAQGIYGPNTVLEGENGYFKAFARDDWQPSTLLDGLGTAWAAMRTYVKPYPCCRHLHGAIDAIRELRANDDITPTAITGVRIGTFSLASKLDRVAPTTLMEAQFSLPFAAATTLLYGTVDLPSLDEPRLLDPEVQRLSRLVEVYTDDAAQEAYPKQRAAAVSITLSDGTVFQRRVEQPLGEPDNPLSDREIEEKFRNLAAPVLGVQRVDEVLAQIWTGNDITVLTRALGESGPQA